MERLAIMAGDRQADRFFYEVERDSALGIPLPPISQRVGGPTAEMRAWLREEKKREKLRERARAYRAKEKAEKLAATASG